MTFTNERAGNPSGPNGEGVSSDSLDMLEGASAIALFLWGEDKPTKRRRVYHLAESNAIPVFYLGQRICARRSKLLDWIAEQERASCAR